MPDNFVPVAQVADIAPGEMIRVAVDGVPVMLAHVGGAFYALRDVCGHRNAPLSRGRLDGCQVECPLHFALFDVRTGRFIDGPAIGRCAGLRGTGRGRHGFGQAPGFGSRHQVRG
ncbi:MAG: Rieske 2Fe-2S domain-containing protein, partial [Stellaceae bacterium]